MNAFGKMHALNPGHQERPYVEDCAARGRVVCCDFLLHPHDVRRGKSVQRQHGQEPENGSADDVFYEFLQADRGTSAVGDTIYVSTRGLAYFYQGSEKGWVAKIGEHKKFTNTAEDGTNDDSDVLVSIRGDSWIYDQ